MSGTGYFGKGGDYSMEDVIGKEYAGEVRILPFVKGYSTTQIINKILGNETLILKRVV